MKFRKNKKILTIISLPLILSSITGCAPSVEEVSSTAWFKDYKTFDQQIKEIDLKNLNTDDKLNLIEHSAMSKYNPCRKMKYLTKHNVTLSKKEYTKLLQRTITWDTPLSASKCLVDLGADIKALDFYKRDLLLILLDNSYPNENNLLEKVKFLVDSGVDINATDISGHTPFYYAKKYKDTQVIQYLYEKLYPEEALAINSKQTIYIDGIPFSTYIIPPKLTHTISCKSLKKHPINNIERRVLSKQTKLGDLTCIDSNQNFIQNFQLKNSPKYKTKFIKIDGSKSQKEALSYALADCKKIGFKKIATSKELKKLSKIYTGENYFWRYYKGKDQENKLGYSIATADGIIVNGYNYKDEFEIDNYPFDYKKSYLYFGCMRGSFISEKSFLSILKTKDKELYNYALMKLPKQQLNNKQKFKIIKTILQNYTLQKAQEILDDIQVTKAINFFENRELMQMIASYAINNKQFESNAKKLNILDTTSYNEAFAHSKGYNSYTLYLQAQQEQKIAQANLKLAQQYGFNSYYQYQLDIEEKKQAIQNLQIAKDHGFKDYNSYQKALQLLQIAQKNGFNSYTEYQKAVKIANKIKTLGTRKLKSVSCSFSTSYVKDLMLRRLMNFPEDFANVTSCKLKWNGKSKRFTTIVNTSKGEKFRYSYIDLRKPTKECQTLKYKSNEIIKEDFYNCYSSN